MLTLQKAIIQQLHTTEINRPILLDLGCGSAPDLLIWQNLNPSHVYGVDANAASIKKAQQRLNQLPERFREKVEFCVTDLTIPHFDLTLPPIANNTVDLISMQCSVGYFFKNAAVIDNLLQWCAAKMKAGAYIVGTNMDGDRVSSLLHSTEGSSIYRHDFFIDCPGNNEVKLARVGAASKHKAKEYLVRMPELTEAMKRAGLQLVEIKPFALWYTEKQVVLGSEESDISFLFTSFVFQKPKLNDTDTKKK